MLNDLIARYYAERDAWQTIFNRDEKEAENCSHWDNYMAAEDAIINFPCQTLEDVRTKAMFVLQDSGAHDTLRNCFTMTGGEQVWTLTPFLRSLLGWSVDKSNNGEN